MKILILANFDVGLYQFRRELIGALLENHSVCLALPDGPLVRPLEQMGCAFADVAIDRRGINPVKDLKVCLDYFRLLRREKPDLVITYTIKPNVYGGMVCRLLGIPYAFAWAILVAAVDAIPLLGTGTVLIPWALTKLLQGSPLIAAGLVALYLVAMITRTVLEPRFFGRHLGLDPLVMLVFLYFGYRLWGFLGIVISPLLAATTKALMERS